jgi:hypothetical protein
MIPFTLHHTLLWYVQFQAKNIAYFSNKDDSIHPAPYIIVICSVSGSVETPSIVGRYSIIDKCTNFLYNWEMTQWLSNKILNPQILVAWYICEWNHYICPNMTLWQSKKGDLYLGLMRVWYTLFATCDTW